METVSEKEIWELRKENYRLQQEIALLKKKQSENRFVKLHGTNGHASEERYVLNVPTNQALPITSTALSQMLSVNDNLSGIAFSDVHKTKVTSDEYILEAECKSYNLLFHLSCYLMTEPDESITVKSLEVIFQDPSLVEEIMYFINSCQREKNMQELLSGIAQYSTLCHIRETVIRWLCNDCSSALLTHSSVDSGTHVIKMYGNQNRELYLTCNWSIRWEKKRHMMSPFLNISVHIDNLPLERRKYVQLICEEPPRDIPGMKEAWGEVTDSLEKLK